MGGALASCEANQRHTASMVWLAGGEFIMGSERYYPEERPQRRVRVDGFWIDPTPVTNRDFAEFVAATHHQTVAEKPLDPADYPGLAPGMTTAGSLVFERTRGPVRLDNPANWWQFRAGAWWREPLGPGSSIDGLEDHPVVHIAYADAEAYAKWLGKSLPTEAEWEFAARGGIEAAEFAWGDELAPAGRMLCNYWQGAFPYENQLLDGYERTSPVGCYPANGFGLYDLIGNVWEWTCDWYAERAAPAKEPGACCVPVNRRGGNPEGSYDPAQPSLRIPRMVIKGGSHLCAENYCQRYRPAARIPQMVDSSTGHVGFRCVLRQLHAAGLPGRNLRRVFLTHHHPDHNADLGIVMMSWWLFGTGQPLGVLGPPGTASLVDSLAAANAPTVLASFPTGNRPPKPPPAELVEGSDLQADIQTPTVVYEDGAIRVSAISVDHFQVPPSVPLTELPRAVAYRVDVGGRNYVYSGDTGPSQNLQTLATDADVLITEVVNIEAIKAYLVRTAKSVPPGAAEQLGADMAMNHLTPENIGLIANAARVKRVVLTHFVPSFEEVEDPVVFTQGIAPAYKGPVTIARDLDRF